MTQTVPAPAAPVRTTAQPIAYRSESASVAGSAVDVLLILVLLLGGVLALAWVAKRKGWLQRWTVGASPLSPMHAGLRVEQALRLSPRTIVFRVIDGERRYLLVESTGNVRFLTDNAVAGDDHV
ncbi:MAG: hypothetical protein ACREPE_03840 [Lysobacter sp.]